MTTTACPFKLPIPGVSVSSGPWQALAVEQYTDGEQKHWPGKPTYVPSDDTVYKIKLARAWAQNIGIIQAGINYYLDELPHGYSLFETRQPGGAATYKRLFGHPTGRYYDSILKFQDHFLWLMSGMEGDCNCVLCGKSERVAIPRTRKAPDIGLSESRRRRDLVLDDLGAESTRSSSAGGLATGREKRARGMGSKYPQDEEGTRDVYKECIQNLHKNKDSSKGIKDDIIEEDSIDYEADHETLTQYFTRIDQQHSFIPRLGELVLWCNYFPDDHYLLKDTETNEFKFFSFDDKAFHGFPDWRAGVVTAVPNSSAVDGPTDFSDILDLPAKKTNLNSSGFRVETIPDPNKGDKSASKQYRYLPLRSIRPLAHWQYVLHGFPRKKLHPSVHHGLTLMTSISLVDKYEFTGEWPNGSVHCKGLYIGSELITIGDAVRIVSTPKASTAVHEDNASSSEWKWQAGPDILIVSSIRMNLLDIDDHHAATSSLRLCSTAHITIIGSAYSLNRSKDYRNLELLGEMHHHNGELKGSRVAAVDPETAKHLFRPVGTIDFGEWYPMHPPRQRYEVSHEQIIGRLHEAQAVKFWTGSDTFKPQPGQQKSSPSLTFDMPGIYSGRQYATETDDRIPEPPKNDPDAIMWHLADYRASALDIATSNGFDVGSYDPLRTKKMLARWRAVLKAIRGDLAAAKELVFTQKGRPAGTRVIDNKLVYADDLVGPSDEGKGYSGKPRGRPVGSRLGPDGKLILPTQSSQGMKSAAREETESEVNADSDLEMLDQGPRPMTGLDGNSSFDQRDSATCFLDEVDDEDDVNELLLADFQDASRSTSSKGKGKGKAPSHSAPLTKEQIMSSVETGDFADDEAGLDRDSDEEQEWWDGPLPPARGGTEESEGGDYDPRKESQEERVERWRKEKLASKARQEEASRTGKEKQEEKYVPPAGYRPWVKDW
jgi:hypothetical protein